MMKSEFEQLTGHTVSIEDYAIIEAAYLAYENLFPDKQSVAGFYKLHGCSVDVFDRLLLDLGNGQLHFLVRHMREMCDSLSNIQIYADVIQREIEKVNSGMNAVTAKNLNCSETFSKRLEKIS